MARIWELRDRRLTIFRGDYSSYHRQRVERDLRAEKEAETQVQQIEREVELVQRYRSQRKHTKMHEHEARLERLRDERTEAPRKSSRSLRLHGRAMAGGPVRSGELVIRLEDLAVGYLPGRGALLPDGTDAPEPVTVATAPFLAAQRGERIGIVGPNGAGKTTLLRTIAGDLPPLDGGITFGHQVQPSYLAQLRDAAIPGATVLDAIMEAIPLTPGEARGYLARFLFRGDDAFKEVRLALGRGAVPPRAGAARDPALQPDAARRADEPPGHRGPGGDRGVPRRVPGDADRRVARPAAARDDLRAPVGGRRRARGPVRRRLPGLEGGRERGLDRGGGGEAAHAPGPAGRRAERPRGRRRRTAARTRCSSRSAVPVAGRSRCRRAARRAATKLSKDAYRRRSEVLDAELARLGLRKTQLELAMANPAVNANFVEMRRVTSELADVERALAEAEDAWLQLEEQAP